MNLQSPLVALPQNLRRRIFSFALPGKVELDVDERGVLRTRLCRLLRICKQIRINVLNACKDGEILLVYTVRIPSALAAVAPHMKSRSLHSVATLSIVLLSALEEKTSALTESEHRGASEGPNISPLFLAWREAFRALPQDTSIDAAYFDLKHSFRLDPYGVARLVHNLSAVVQQRSRGRANATSSAAGRFSSSGTSSTLLPMSSEQCRRCFQGELLNPAVIP